MKKHFILAALLCGSLFALNAAEASLDDSITLAVDFDDTTEAVKSAGRASVAEFRGTQTFVEGVSGKAIRLGEKAGCPLYQSKDNLNFDNPATIVFWFKGENWHGQKSGRGVGLWGIGNAGGLLMIQTASGKEGACPCRQPLELYLLHSKVRKNARHLLQPPALTKLCQGWHMVSVAWDKEQIYLSYDGAPYKGFKLQVPLSNAEFAHCNRFAIGTPSNKNFAVDNFRIYGKKLTDAELLSVWEAGKALLDK